MYMEGVLWKWTNYFSGWQSRWFVLDSGILAYYKSEDEVNNGCKGSVNLSVCDIVAHSTDPCRLDLIIPGEQHFYIRASSLNERQKWLVGLGSSKASITPGSHQDDSGSLSPDIVRSKKSELRLYCDLLMQQVHSIKMATQDKESPDMETMMEVTSLLGPTCDTFIQTLEDCMNLVQVSQAFEGSHQHITDATHPPSPLKLEARKVFLQNRRLKRSNSSENHRNVLIHTAGSRSPLVSSADSTPGHRPGTRQRTASESSALAGLSIYENPSSSPRNTFQAAGSHTGLNRSNSATSPRVPYFQGEMDMSRVCQTEQRDSRHFGDKSKTTALQSLTENTVLEPTVQIQPRSVSNINPVTKSDQDTEEDSVVSDSKEKTSLNTSDPFNTSSNQAQDNEDLSSRENVNGDVITSDGDLFLDPIEDRVPTFFSAMKPSFLDLRFIGDGGIPVEHFLGACKSLIPMFDKLSATAFAPVKMDFQGNIRKVRQKYLMNTEGFPTLQSIILAEIAANQNQQSSSATMALLWMKRSLEFLLGLVAEMKKGDENMGTAASIAYTNSLKPYHGWLVRGVFAVAVKALPYKSTFISLLGPDDEKMEGPAFENSLLADIDVFGTALGVILKVLNDFFKICNLDTDEKV